MSNYLAFGSNNKIFALDPTTESLKLGVEFSKKNNLTNIKFINADIKDDIFQNEIFDFVLCSGVLHHTDEPYVNFKQIPKILKKNGYVVLGLYNYYGRFRTKVRQKLFKFFGKSLIMLLDPILRKLSQNKKKIN